MKIVFLSNFLLHHQTDFCEKLSELCEGMFYFVATTPITEERLKLGYKDYSKSNIKYYLDGTDPNNKEKLSTIIDEADAVIIGSAPWDLVEKRVNDGKLVFIYSERIAKTFVQVLKAFLRGTLHKRFIKAGRKQNVRLLCASGFLPKEMKFLHTFKDQMYQWGYYPPLSPECVKNSANTVKVLFAGRLIKWKRPIYAVKLAKEIKKRKLNAKVKLVGTGKLEQKLQKFARKNNLLDVVDFEGPMSPDLVRKEMENADVFLFPSNKEEGWGAVLNEAMNSKCAVIASNKIGSVPFMVKDKQNGLIFKDGCFSQLFRQFLLLYEDRTLMNRLGKNAYHTVQKEWNGKEAARRLYILTEQINDGFDTPFETGPCSKINN